MSAPTDSGSEIPRPGSRLLQGLFPFATEGWPLRGDEERFADVFNGFDMEAGVNDVELPRNRDIGRVNHSIRRFGRITLYAYAALLHEASGMMPRLEEGRLLGQAACSISNPDSNATQGVYFEYHVYDSGIVKFYHGDEISEDSASDIDREDFFAALLELGFDDEVEYMREGGTVSMENDVEFAEERHVEGLITVLTSGENPDMTT